MAQFLIEFCSIHVARRKPKRDKKRRKSHNKIAARHAHVVDPMRFPKGGRTGRGNGGSVGQGNPFHMSCLRPICHTFQQVAGGIIKKGTSRRRRNDDQRAEEDFECP